MTAPSASIVGVRNPRDVVVVSAVRTPLCRARKGKLADVPPSTLLSAALGGCLDRAGGADPFPAGDVEDVCVGNVLSPASGAAAFRMAQLRCGFPHTVPLSAVNRQCSSGLQAVANVANSIASGQIDVGIGAGVESMSCHPMKDVPPPDVDWDDMRLCQEAMDCLIPMGVTSENVVREYGGHGGGLDLDRAALDSFAVESHRRAAAARSSGKFRDEIVPVAGVSEDDGIRPGTTLGGLSKLRPAFAEDGSTTAGNSSQMTDGAAAVLLMTRREAERRGLPILGVWRGYAVAGVPPRIMGVGPAAAIPMVLSRLGMSVGDVDVYEINEAFASQAHWSVRELGLDPRRVNPNGGAIALGHPLGATGARQVATLLHEMNRRNRTAPAAGAGIGTETGGGSRFGVVSMCIGTGMGAAAVFEVEGPQPPRSSL